MIATHQCLGVAEVSQREGVRAPTVLRWRDARVLPVPVAVLKSTSVWTLGQLEAHDAGLRGDEVPTPKGENGDPLELLGTSEAAKLLGVDKSRISRWRRTDAKPGDAGPGFPVPYAELRAGPIWLRSQIDAFANSR